MSLSEDTHTGKQTVHSRRTFSNMTMSSFDNTRTQVNRPTNSALETYLWDDDDVFVMPADPFELFLLATREGNVLRNQFVYLQRRSSIRQSESISLTYEDTEHQACLK